MWVKTETGELVNIQKSYLITCRRIEKRFYVKACFLSEITDMIDIQSFDSQKEAVNYLDELFHELHCDN